MSKQLVKKEKNELSTEMAGLFDSSLQSAADNMEAKDLIIAKVHLAQPLTPEVLEKKIEGGAYMNSVSKKGLGENVKVFVMSDTKLWQYYYQPKNSNKKEYLGTTEYFGNEKAREIGGIPEELVQRASDKGVDPKTMLPPDEVFRFYVILESDLANGSPFPYMVDFKRSSFTSGKELKNTMFRVKQQQNYPSYAYAYELGSKMVSNDKGTYYEKTFNQDRLIKKEEIAIIETWIKELAANKDKYKEDENEVEEEQGATFEATATSKDDIAF